METLERALIVDVDRSKMRVCDWLLTLHRCAHVLSNMTDYNAVCLNKHVWA